MTFYAIKQKGGQMITKYRFSVSIGHGWMTGEAYHIVCVESAWGFKDLRGGHWLSSRYQHEQRTSVHCCYTHREAADYVARNMGLELI